LCDFGDHEMLGTGLRDAVIEDLLWKRGEEGARRPRDGTGGYLLLYCGTRSSVSGGPWKKTVGLSCGPFALQPPMGSEGKLPGYFRFG